MSQRYIIMWKTKAQKRFRISVMDLLEGGHSQGKLTFSGRPNFGTTVLQKADVCWMLAVSHRVDIVREKLIDFSPKLCQRAYLDLADEVNDGNLNDLTVEDMAPEAILMAYICAVKMELQWPPTVGTFDNLVYDIRFADV